jgi:CheY-like chemotaxis protein
MDGPPYPVLIADDSEVDRFFLKRAIVNGATRLRIVAEVEDGEKTIAYLSGSPPYDDRGTYPFPKLLLLDSRMPRRDGLEVLEWLQAHPIPELKVAMLADSSGTALESKSLALGAAYFFSKLLNSDELIRNIQTLQADLERGDRMKVVLQHPLTHCYLQGPGRWTPLLNEGMDFQYFERALAAARDLKLADTLQVAVVFLETGQQYLLPCA